MIPIRFLNATAGIPFMKIFNKEIDETDVELLNASCKDE